MKPRVTLTVGALMCVAATVSVVGIPAVAQEDIDLTGGWDMSATSTTTGPYGAPGTIGHDVDAGTFVWRRNDGWSGTGTVSGTSFTWEGSQPSMSLTATASGTILDNGDRLEGNFTQSDGQEGTIEWIRTSRPSPSPTVPGKCPGYEDDPRPQIVGTAVGQTLTGTSEAEVICGLGGVDRIEGGGGNDLLLGGGGADTIFGGNDVEISRGGTGNDTIRARGSPSGSLQDPTFDQLFGGAGEDTLFGGSGRDLILGGINHDEIVGGEDPDVIDGGGGPDDIDGGADFDSVDGGIGVAVDKIHGGGGPDVLHGAEGDDHLYGEGEEDELSGGPGDDRLFGGPHLDELDGGADRDRCRDDPRDLSESERCEVIGPE